MSRDDWYRDNRGIYRKGGGWEDLRFPASAINPPGAVSDPDRSTDTGCLLFDASGTEVVVIQAQLPHDLLHEFPLIPHVHWTKTTDAAGDVLWRLQYKWYPVDAVGDAEWTVLTVSTPVPGTPDTDEAEKHLISVFGEIDIRTRRKSDMLVMAIARLGGGAEDTYAADAQLLEFDCHQMLRGAGTPSQY